MLVGNGSIEDDLGQLRYAIRCVYCIAFNGSCYAFDFVIQGDSKCVGDMLGICMVQIIVM